jgi:hypothetical protein
VVEISGEELDLVIKAANIIFFVADARADSG